MLTMNPQACTIRPQTSSPAVRRSWQRGGAVLAVMAGLLVVAASTLAIRMARQVEARTELQQLNLARMERIRAALHAYAATQGRLPCPVAGTTPDDSTTGAGLASPPGPSVTTCTAPNGTVPWVSLGLPAEAAQDAWGRKISYRVFGDLVKDDGVKNTSPTTGLGVNDGAASHTGLAWVLIFHGVSGLGARLPNGQQILPIPASQESVNTQATGPFIRREESVVDLDPATSLNYFDDVLMYESVADLKNHSGFDLNTRMTTRRLDSGPGGKVTYTGRNANTASITFDSSTEWGDITVSSPGGNISRNAYGTGIGVCSGACNDDATAALDASKKLTFKLDVGKTAQKFSIGILSIEPTVEFLLTFKNGGIPVGFSVRVPLPPPPPALPDPPPPKPVELGKLVKFDYLQPNPPGSFNEVEIQPLGTSRFFIASIRFCTAAENCT